MTTVLSVKANVLEKNQRLAGELRERFAREQVTALNFVSSPGAGKTTLLVATIEALKNRCGVAVVEGDQETAHDAERIAATGVPVVQLNTGSACHLDAGMVAEGVEGLDLAAADLLLIENVGNLVCPASYDLGERMKVVVMSVTEGEDKPRKYPKMFRVSSALVVTKADLLPHLDFDLEKAVACAREVNPGLAVFVVSVKSGEGMAAWTGYVTSLLPA